MEALFLNLLNMSITAGWLVLAVVLLRFILKKAPKSLTVCLWALVAIRLVFPFSVESVLSLIPSKETVPQNIVYSPAPVIDSGIEAFNSAVNPIISQSLAPNPGDSVNPLQVITAIASVLWLVGLCVMLVYSLVSYLYLRNKVRITLNYKDNIYFCDNIDTPFILGMLRPRIYLPSGMNENDIDYVLLHERAHLKRKDHFWKPLAFTLLSVYWFNPVLWIGYMLLCRDIELACDEKVIKDFDCHDKKGYSQALVSCSVHRRTVMACPLAFGEVGVKGRIKSVLNYKKPAFWIILVAVIASIVLGICFLTDPINKIEDDETLIAFLDKEIYSHYGSSHKAAFYQSMDFEILGDKKEGDNLTVYMWVLHHEYSYDKGLKQESGSHILTAITAKKVGDSYELVEYWEPRDGSYYDDDIATLPLPVRLKAYNHDKYFEKMLPRVEQKALNYFASEINTVEYTASLSKGSALLYETSTKRGAIPVITATSSFSDEDMKELLALLKKQSWENYNASNKTDYYFNGCIGYDNPIFFGNEQKVVFYGAYYCTADSEVFRMLDKLLENSVPFFGFARSTDCFTIGQLKKKCPEYFEFDPEKGLSVYVGQMAINSYSCAIYEGKYTTYSTADLLKNRTISVREARLVLSYYGLDESEVTVSPISIPHSSYAYEISKSYADRIRNMLLYPMEKINIDPESIIDKAEYDVDGDGILEDCYLVKGYTSGFLTFLIEIIEQGSEHVLEYHGMFYSFHGILSFTEKNGRLAVNLNPHSTDDNLIYYVKTPFFGTASLEADENNVKDKYGDNPIHAAGRYTTTETEEDKQLTALKIRVPEYFNISDFKSSEIYTWQTDNGNAYGILPGTSRLKNYDEIKSMKPVSYDELTLILSTYGLSETEIKNMTAIKITISDGEYSFGFTSDSIEALKKQFPQYFGLSTSKGLEVYVWQTGEFEYFCGLLPGRDLDYTNAVLQALKPASLADMKTIIASYGLPRKEVTVIPMIKHDSKYKYTIDNDYSNKIHELFWDYAEVSFNYPSPDSDNWGVKMDVTFKNGSDFEISLVHSAGLATKKGKLTAGPDYEIKAIHNGKIMSYGNYLRNVKGFGYEDKILAWDTVLYTIPENGVLKIEGTTKLFDDVLPKGEYVICKPVTLEDENGNRTTREYTYVFYSYG